MRTIEEAELSGKRVILRIDGNVPSVAKNPSERHRLKAVVPTIHFLLDRGAKVIIVSHLGRPKGQIVEELRLGPIYRALEAELEHPIKYAPEIFSAEVANEIDNLKNGEILGLENIRFEAGEEENSRTFAKKLAAYGDLFVNDAFAVSHRQAASICAITEFLPSYGGFLLEQEVRVLTSLTKDPDRPFVAVIGGAKIADKLDILKSLVTRVDHLLLGGAIANTFLLASKVEVKNSLVEADFVDLAAEIIKKSRGRLHLPIDYIWDENDRIVDIGPKTIEQYSRFLDRAKILFWNGNLGLSEDERYRTGSDTIAHEISEIKGTTIVGGGNTVEILMRLHLTPKINFVSTGGGATLEFLAGRRLPGLVALD